MSKAETELEIMQACWAHLRLLSPESRTAVVMWLFDHMEDEVVDGYTVHMFDFGAKKINVIKALRAQLPGLGLKEAKELVESAPVDVWSGRDSEKACAVARALVEVGAEVTVDVPVGAKT